LFQQLRENGGFVLLSWGQQERHQLALPFRSEVDFGAETTPAAAERFGVRVPPFAPAACW
jgi:hypothetical protein